VRGAQIPSPESEIIKLTSALPLLMARVLADDADNVLALHDAAALAKAFDGCSYFHGWKSGWNLEDKKSR
jgi:hypothetical protein